MSKPLVSVIVPTRMLRKDALSEKMPGHFLEPEIQGEFPCFWHRETSFSCTKSLILLHTKIFQIFDDSAEFLFSCLRSIIRQSYGNIELIVVDNLIKHSASQ